MSDLKERLDALFIDIQNQATLAMFDKTLPLGLIFKIDRSHAGHSLKCEVQSPDKTSLGFFTIGAGLSEGSVVIRTYLCVSVDGYLSVAGTGLADADVSLKVGNALADVARVLDKTYCQPWNQTP